MEMPVCFLLLLLCSLSTAQLQSHDDSHITAPGEQAECQRRDTTDASNQNQTSPPDIYVALKDLERKNKEQEAKLESQRAEVERQKVEVEKLKQSIEVKQVAFSAGLSASGDLTLGPLSTHTLVFKHVFSNIGNAYNSDTGNFTAPVRGAYHFEFYVGAHGHTNYGSATGLVKNGELVLVAYERQDNGYGSSANGVTLLLEVGDVVFLRLQTNTRIFDNDNNYSTFSGHLLFTI